MIVTTPDIVSLIDRCVLCWLATSDPLGHPNVSPKEIFCLGSEDQLLIADIASPGSVSNIGAQPNVCISMVDIFDQRGVKLTGKATLINCEEPDFAAIAKPLIAMAGPRFPIKNVIIVALENKAPIIAPSYYLRRDQSNLEKRNAAYKAYGVRPISGRRAE